MEGSRGFNPSACVSESVHIAAVVYIHKRTIARCANSLGRLGSKAPQRMAPIPLNDELLYFRLMIEKDR